MSRLILFRQRRVDGGLRQGISSDGDSILGKFEPGTAESDPALLWFVDLRATGEQLPTDAESIQPWFKDHGPKLVHTIEEAAAAIPAGFDVDFTPYHFASSGPIGGANVVVVAGAARRIEAIEMAQVLRQFAVEFDSVLADLDPLALSLGT